MKWGGGQGGGDPSQQGGVAEEAGMVARAGRQSSHLEPQTQCRKSKGREQRRFNLNAAPTGVLSPARLYHLSVPKQHRQLGIVCSNARDYGGHLLFKPPPDDTIYKVE